MMAKKKQKVKKKGRGLNRLGWWISILLPLGLVFKALHYPGSDIFLFLGTLLATLFFIPGFYIKGWNNLKLAYRHPSFIVIQVAAFFVLPWVNLFILQSYPGAKLMKLLLLPLVIVILLSFWGLKKIQIQHPIRIATLVILPFLSLNIFVQSIAQNNYRKAILPVLNDLVQKNKALKNDPTLSLNVEEKEFLEYVYNFEQALLDSLKYTTTVDAFLSTESLAANNELHNYDRASALLVGDDPSSIKKGTYSAFELKSNLSQFLNNVDSTNLEKLKRVALYQTDSVDLKKFYDNATQEDWEIWHFYHTPLSTVFTFTQSLKHLALSMAKNRQLPEELQAANFESTCLLPQTEFEKRSYESIRVLEDSQGPFITLMGFGCLMILTIFYIPRFKLSETWKKRILLFIVVIIFEYILLVADYFVGIFSSGVEMILGVNILLALGLVAVDSFLRNNFLEWYKK